MSRPIDFKLMHYRNLPEAYTGRARDKVAARLGAKPRSLVKALVIDLNVNRRHLRETQRAFIGALLANMPQG